MNRCLRLIALGVGLSLWSGAVACGGHGPLGGVAGTTGAAGAGGTTGAGAETGAAGAGGAAGTTGEAGTGGTGTAVAGGKATLTEWRLPIATEGFEPFQIAYGNGAIYYLDKQYEQHLGRLDLADGMVTTWAVASTATSPAGIEVRPSDGVVFMTAGTRGEIEQFDPATQVLTRWKLAFSDMDVFPGPWSLAFDDQGGVFFALNDGNTLIGRLDTATAKVDLWDVAPASTARVLVGAGGTVSFTVWGGDQPAIARLDTATGIVTLWPLPVETLYPAVADAAGNIFFQELSSAFSGMARLDPSTGRLREWATTLVGNDCLTMEGERVFFSRPGQSNFAYPPPGRTACSIPSCWRPWRARRARRRRRW
jgi:DNA-binding beta-propeller fold protein YncE